MTSGNFETILIDSIIIERGTRQRRELRGLDELAASIKARGLINPPVITRDYILIAGERRTEACRRLGWSSIPVQFADEVDESELQLIELEENTKRLDLTWQEQNDALARYHLLRAQAEPEWSQAKTAEALGLTRQAVNQHMLVAKARHSGAIADIDKAEKFSTALGLAQRADERKRYAVQREAEPSVETFGLPPVEETADTPPAPARQAAILNANFLTWAEEAHTPFNLIHCDFPYGVNTGDKSGQSAAKRLGSYADSAEIYWQLLEGFTRLGPNFIAERAHLIFWFSMKYYTETKQVLESGGWKVDPFPLIWHKSDNAGIIPDRDRGGRRVYETAFFASRGDQKIVRALSNLYAAPTTKDFHTSEKSALMLEHFFRMVVDGSTRLLDPTCGSGMAVKVAEQLGASYALGLERDEEFAEAAKRNCSL